MNYRRSRIQSTHKGYPKEINIYKVHPAKTVIEDKISFPFCNNYSDKIQIIEKDEKTLEKKKFFNNEVFKIIKAMSLALSILMLCYYGSCEYNVLPNGQIIRGFPPRKTVVIFNFGYSVLHSIIPAIAASMLIYSIIAKRPQFSLPFIGFFLAELVCDFCDMIIMIWCLFEHLQIQTALFYTAGLLLLILAEIWIWLDVVRLYENRNFKI